jgi:hypothetical protein
MRQNGDLDDEATEEWLTLAGEICTIAESLDTHDAQSLSCALSRLRAVLASAMSHFLSSGGISVAERANLHQILNAHEPASVPPTVLRTGLHEGAQQLWAIASLLRVARLGKDPADVPPLSRPQDRDGCATSCTPSQADPAFQGRRSRRMNE